MCGLDSDMFVYPGITINGQQPRLTSIVHYLNIVVGGSMIAAKPY